MFSNLHCVKSLGIISLYVLTILVKYFAKQLKNYLLQVHIISLTAAAFLALMKLVILINVLRWRHPNANDVDAGHLLHVANYDMLACD